MNFSYNLSSVCATSVSFEMDENLTVSNVKFTKGCPGNTMGIGSLTNGRSADEIINALRNTTCGNKPTSCPDQLSIAIEKAKDEITSQNVTAV